MAAAIEIRLDGIEKLQRRLDALPGKIQRRAIRKPLRATATKVGRSLRSGTPRRTGAGKKAVKITVRVKPKSAWARVKYRGRPAGYLHVYQFGATARRHHQAARPFFVQAVGNWQTDAKAPFAASLKAAVEREEDALGE